MSDEILNTTAEQMKEHKTRIEEVKKLIAFLRDTGTDTTDQENKLRRMEITHKKWADALTKRGYTV